MSLVGSEVDVSFGDRNGSVEDKEGCLPNVVSNDEEDDELNALPYDYHPPVTPPRPAEALFFNDLNTQSISAAALAQQIHRTHRSSGWTGTGTSVNTDDFQSAVGWDGTDTPRLATPSSDFFPSSSQHHADDSDGSNEDSFGVFQKDVLSRTNNYSQVNSVPEDTFQDSMSTKTSSMSTPPTSSGPSSSAGGKSFNTQDMHVDPAEKVYDTAKGVWAWGKGVMVISPFLGVAEGVAGKVVGMTGNSLESVDDAVVDQLHGLDDNILNPAIQAIVSTVLGAAGKTEDVLKPIIIAILKPLGLIKNTAENPEVTTVKGVNVSSH